MMRTVEYKIVEPDLPQNEAERLPLVSTKVEDHGVTIHFWKSATMLLGAMLIFFTLLLGILSVYYYKTKGAPAAPTWPSRMSFNQSVTTTNFVTSDNGRAWYDWTTKSFRSEHTNLWDTGCAATLLWIHTDLVIFNDTYCCYSPLQTQNMTVMPPNWISKHIYTGTAVRNDKNVRVWFSPVMSSIYYDTIEEPHIPVRWDNTPNIAIGGKGALTTTYTNVILEPVFPAGIFNMSHLCDSRIMCHGLNLCNQ
jgi:hypothetical protein